MSLLLPDTGLLFWMLVSFGIVFVILAKFGFPVITKMIEERKAFIDNSLESARQANEQLAGIQAQGEAILNQARQERAALVEEAMETKRQIIEEAKAAATVESRKQMEKVAQEIEVAKERAIRDIRTEIATISIQMTEKIIREKLSHPDAQKEMINRLLDEMPVYKS